MWLCGCVAVWLCGGLFRCLGGVFRCLGVQASRCLDVQVAGAGQKITCLVGQMGTVTSWWDAWLWVINQTLHTLITH